MYQSLLKGRHGSWVAKSILLALMSRGITAVEAPKSQNREFIYSSKSVHDSVNLLRKYNRTKIYRFSKWCHTHIQQPHVMQVYQPVGLQPNLVWAVDAWLCSGTLDNNTMGEIFNSKHVFRFLKVNRVNSIVCMHETLNQKHSESIWLSKSESEMWTFSNFSLEYCKCFSSFTLLSLLVIFNASMNFRWSLLKWWTVVTYQGTNRKQHNH